MGTEVGRGLLLLVAKVTNWADCFRFLVSYAKHYLYTQRHTQEQGNPVIQAKRQYSLDPVMSDSGPPE